MTKLSKVIIGIGGFLSLMIINAQSANAGSLSANLNAQLELIRSCRVNGQISTGTTNNYGELNFGETSANFNGTINTTLNNSFNGLQIQCSDSSQVTVTFDGGLHSANVPSTYQSGYYRAMSNGNNGYIAYNLLDGNGTVINSGGNITLNDTTTAKVINLQGIAINDGTPLATGDYSDTVSVLIGF